MTPFTPLRPHDLDEAVGLLAEHPQETKVMCGGQSLLLAMKDRKTRPGYLLSLAGLPELLGIDEAETGELMIGAAVTYAELSRAELSGWRAELAALAGNLADRCVRNLATIGGAACQADPRFDVPPFLMAVNATLVARSVRGERRMAAADFFDPAGGAALQADEILVSIVLPPKQAFHFVGFDKFRFRVFEAAVLTMALAFRLDGGGLVADNRLIVGGVAPAPVSAACASPLLDGARPGAWDAAAVGEAASLEIIPPERRTTRRLLFQAELIKTYSTVLLKRAADEAEAG